MKKFFIFLGAVTLTLFSSVSNVKASEMTETSGKIDYDEVSLYFEENNIPKEKQQILLDKLESGELWDCYNEEKVKNIPEDFFALDPLNLTHEKTYTFPDGSTIEVALEIPEDQYNRNIETYGSQSVTGGIEYWDIKIDKTIGLLKAWFYADFFVSNTTSKPSVIHDVWGANVSGFGVVDKPSLTIQRKTEDIAKSRSALAYSQWLTQVTISGGWGDYVSGSIPIGSTCNLYLGLIRGKVHVSPTLPYK